MTIDEERRLRGNWRGRRLLICRATDGLQRLIDDLGTDDGSLADCQDPKLPVSEAQKIMLHNLNEVLREMLLLANDGRPRGKRL